MICSNCGKQLPENSAFCRECGFRQTPVVQQNNTLQPKKKRSGCLTAIAVIVIVAVAAFAGIYLLMPGLLKPYDLGVKSSAASYERATEKLKMSKDTVSAQAKPGAYSIAYGEPHKVDTALSSEEVTSFLNENRPSYYALKNVQIRINDDDTVDASATVDTSYIFQEVFSDRYTKEDAKKALPMLGLLPGKIRVQCTIDGAIRDNQIERLNLSDVSVMGIPLPKTLLASPQSGNFIQSTLDGYIARSAAKSGASFDMLQVENGMLQFEGALPSSISHVAVGSVK